MNINVNEITAAIKRVGVANTRIQPATQEGKFVILISDGGTWREISAPLSESLANKLLAEAQNKVICG